MNLFIGGGGGGGVKMVVMLGDTLTLKSVLNRANFCFAKLVRDIRRT